MIDSDDDNNFDYEGRRSLTIFGRDVSKIPCFRESFMYGISSGIVIGLGCFMSTSKPRLAQHVAIGSFMLITLSYWFHCRYDWSRKSLLAAQIQEGLRRNALYEGTELHKKILDETSEIREA